MEIGNKWLPPGLVLEILLRLSVVSVLRCKSVCKLWFTLISTPSFVKTHLTLSTRNNDFAHNRLIYLSTLRGVNLKSCNLYDVLNKNHVNNPLEENYPLKSLGKSASIVGCCHGLLCIVVDDILFVWNPSTRVSFKLPQCDLISWRGWYGFGYDELSEDYKVVAIDLNAFRGEYRNNVKMYSLKSGKWKDIGDFPHGNTGVGSCTFMNGAFHWMTGHNDSFYPYRIVSLDLATETYGEVLQGVYEYEGDKALRLGALGGWLCVVCNNGEICADVWVMKVYGVKDSWTKLLSIQYPTADWSFFASFPLCFSDDGKVLFKYRSKFVLYDSKNTLFSEIISDDGCVKPYTFVESLVSPIGLGRVFNNWTYPEADTPHPFGVGNDEREQAYHEAENTLGSAQMR